MSRHSLHLDERNVAVIRRVCTVMYLLTLLGLIAIVNVRQFALGQPRSAYDDVAMLLTLNVIGLLGAVLYFGGVTLPRPRLVPILGLYALFVLLGVGVTWVKYAVVLNQPMDPSRLLHTVYVISSILAMLMLLWGVVAWLGGRRLERELE
jgi:ABC-type transport system involved in cytochrome c biogenesis permease subunit